MEKQIKINQEICDYMYNFVKEHIDELKDSYEVFGFKDKDDMLNGIKSDINGAYWALTELCSWGMTSNYTQTHFKMYEDWFNNGESLNIIYKIGDKHYRFDGDYVRDYTMIPIEVKKITRMVEQIDWIDVDTISVDDTEYFKEKALTSTKSLYNDINNCISLLLKGRSNKNKDVEGQALSEMERLMCSTLQQLDCLIDYINDYKN